MLALLVFGGVILRWKTGVFNESTQILQVFNKSLEAAVCQISFQWECHALWCVWLPFKMCGLDVVQNLAVLCAVPPLCELQGATS